MMEKSVIKVLLVNDSEIVRRRLIAMLSKIMRTENTGQGKDAPGTIDSIHKVFADAVIPDIRIPGASQMDVLLEIESNNQTLPAIAPTDYPYRQYPRKYVEARADFFFDKLTRFDGLTAVLGPLHQIRRL